MRRQDRSQPVCFACCYLGRKKKKKGILKTSKTNPRDACLHSNARKIEHQEIWSWFQITAVWQTFRKINLARSNWSTSLSDISENSKDSSTPCSDAKNLWLLLTFAGGDKTSGITWDLCNNREERDYSTGWIYLPAFTHSATHSREEVAFRQESWTQKTGP